MFETINIIIHFCLTPLIKKLPKPQVLIFFANGEITNFSTTQLPT